MKYKFKYLLLNCLILLSLGIVHPLWAADKMLTSSIGFIALYDDNVAFESDENKRDDFLYAVNPSLTFDYATEITKFKANALLDYQNYIDNSTYNALNQTYKLEGDSNFTELLTLSADLKYIRDNTLESQVEETGKVEQREDRQRYDLKGKLFLNFTELIRIGGSYQFRNTEYDSEYTEDYSDDTVSFIYNQRLKNQLDSLIFISSYAYREVRTHETNTYRALFGWSRDLSETFKIKVSLGGRFTEQYTYDSNSTRLKSETNGYLADISFFKQSDFWLTELEYRRDQVYGSRNDGAFEVDFFKIGLKRNLTERLKTGIELSLYLTRDVDENVTQNSHLYAIKPNITYNLTEYHVVGLYYSYQGEYDDSRPEDEETADRNRVWIGLAFNFPKQL